MALSERTRSKIFTQLGPIIGEEAIGEMLTYFPARDVEEPASKEFIRAESASLRGEMTAAIAELRGEMRGIKQLLVFNAAMMLAMSTAIIAAIRL